MAGSSDTAGEAVRLLPSDMGLTFHGCLTTKIQQCVMVVSLGSGVVDLECGLWLAAALSQGVLYKMHPAASKAALFCQTLHRGMMPSVCYVLCACSRCLVWWRAGMRHKQCHQARAAAATF
jgi:hypothetical protein